MSTALSIAKLTVKLGASIGTSKVVNDIIKSNTNPATAAEQAQVVVGAVVLGSMIGDASSKHVNSKLESFGTAIAEAKARRIAKKESKD